MIERFAGIPSVTPSLREVPVEDAAAADFGHRLLVGEFGVVIFLTGVGFQYLLSTIERQLPRERYLHALTDIVTIARGPKVVHAMRELGLQPTYAAEEPHTWRELLTTIDRHVPVDNQVVAIQEYGESNVSLVAGLEARGARVVTVPVYRWELPEDPQPLEDAVRALADGRLDVVLFTAAIQVTHVLQVAQQLGLEPPLRQAMWRMVVGSIGPTTSETLRRHDLPVDVEPEHAKLGHLVREAAEQAAEILEKKSRVRVQIAATATRRGCPSSLVRQPVPESLSPRADRGDPGVAHAAGRPVHGRVPPRCARRSRSSNCAKIRRCAARSCARPSRGWVWMPRSCSPICCRFSNRWGSIWSSRRTADPSFTIRCAIRSTSTASWNSKASKRCIS